MAHLSEEEKALRELEQTAEAGLFTQHFGEFLAGTVPLYDLFQFLSGMHVLPQEAQHQFLQLLQTFETEAPGIQQVSFVPRTHHKAITVAVQNLMLNTEDFHTGMEISSEPNKYSITAFSTIQSVQSIKHNLTYFRHPSDFSLATRRYVEDHSSPLPSDGSFYARRSHGEFLQSHPFVRITVEQRKVTQMTVGFGVPFQPNSGPSPILLPPR